jgi:fibronectin type 3 domain-containing protein
MMKCRPVLIPLAAAMSLACVALLLGCSGKSTIAPASEMFAGQVKISWDEVPGAVSYNVYYGTSAGLTKWNCVKIPNASQPVTLTDIAWGRSYFFGISVVTESGESGILAETAHVVKEKEGTVHFSMPERPKRDNKAAEPQGLARNLILAWDSVPGAIYYNVYLSQSPGVTRQTGRKIGNVSNPHTLTGLTAGAAYYVVITAVSESGESKESEELSFTAQ